MNHENKRIIIDEHYTEANYPFTIKPSFSTLSSIKKILSQGPIIILMPIDCIRDLFQFNATTIYGEYNISTNPVDILSFDNIFLKCDIAQAMIFKRRRSGLIYNFNTDVNPGFKYFEKIRGRVQC